MPFVTLPAPGAQAVARPLRTPAPAARRAHQQRALIAALVRAGDPHGVDLANRLHRCLDGRERRRERPTVADALRGGFGYRCRSPACVSCRAAIIRRLAATAGDFLRHAGATNEDASLATVHLALARDVGAVPAIVKKARSDLRNRRAAEARRARDWRRLSGIGYVELDAVSPEDVPLLGPMRRALVPALPLVAPTRGDGAIRLSTREEDAPLWLAHIHFVAHHPSIGRADFRDGLARQWPGPHRVHTTEFHPDHPAPENAETIAAYALKHDMATTFGDGRRAAWPAAWAATHAAWLHGLRRGFQPLRVTLGAGRV